MTQVNHQAAKELIVATLRSGEFTQGAGRLAQDGCHCVWGVICEAYAKAHPDETVKKGGDVHTTYFGYTALPPVRAQCWAGISENELFTVGDNEDTLMALNDTRSATFAQMADAIEAKLNAEKAAAAQALIVTNLTTLRDAVAAQPEEKFNLSKYKQATACGTLFCTAGLATTLPTFQEQGMSLQPYRFGFLVTVNGQDVDQHGDDSEANKLFGDDAWRNCFAARDDGRRDKDFPIRGEEHWGFSSVGKDVSDKELAVWRLDQQIIAEEAKVVA